LSSYHTKPGTPVDTRYAAFLQGINLWNVYSQNCEDSILAAIFERIGTANKWCFECGAADGLFFSNTKLLIDQGWHAVLVEWEEGDYQRLQQVFERNERVNVERAYLVALNRGGNHEFTVDRILELNDAPKDIDLVVIDIDSQDYYLLNSIVKYRPRVILVEFAPDADPMFIPELNGPGQAGHLALRYVAEARGYEVICRTATNLVCVRKDLAKLLEEPASEPEPQAATRYLKRAEEGSDGECVMGVGEGSGDLFIKGSYEALKIVREALEQRQVDQASIAKQRGPISVYHLAKELKVESAQIIREVFQLGGSVNGMSDLVPLEIADKVRERLSGDRFGFELRKMNEILRERYRKDEVPKKQSVQIAAVMSVPRLGYLDTLNQIQGVLAQAKAPLGMCYGVFWHHALTRGIEKALDWRTSDGKAADYILTIDYDSYVTLDNLGKLAVLLADNPEVDIVVPMQAKRAGGEILAGTDGPVDLTKPLVPIVTGHFGFTLFKREVFERLNKPWFWEKPAPDGGWGEGRVDADIGFWRNVIASGCKPFLATQVVVGHGEEVVSWPQLEDGVLTVGYQTVKDWQEERQAA